MHSSLTMNKPVNKNFTSDETLPAGTFGLNSIVPLPWLKTCRAPHPRTHQ